MLKKGNKKSVCCEPCNILLLILFCSSTKLTEKQYLPFILCPNLQKNSELMKKAINWKLVTGVFVLFLFLYCSCFNKPWFFLKFFFVCNQFEFLKFFDSWLFKIDNFALLFKTNFVRKMILLSFFLSFLYLTNFEDDSAGRLGWNSNNTMY